MAIVDFTTFTEVDPNNDITVTANKCDVSTMIRNVEAYVRKDYGAGYFGDFTHELTVRVGSSDVWSVVNFWGLSNGANTFLEQENNHDGLSLTANRVDPEYKLVLFDHETVLNDSAVINPNTTYYLTIKRQGEVLTCEIFTDSDRTILHSAIMVICNTTLYRYLYSVMSREATGTQAMSGYCENLDLVTEAPPNYQYYREITIDCTKVPGNLINYPLLFSSIIADLKTVANGGKINNTALGGVTGDLTVPADLVFAGSSDGSNKYYFEIQKYDPTTGELIAHVRIPSVSATENTVLYLVYGDPAVTVSQEVILGVWDANYAAVHHLESATYTALDDSTVHGNDVTSESGTPSYQQAGKIGYCVQGDGDDNLGIPDADNLEAGTNFTVEVWFTNTDAQTTERYFAMKYNTGTNCWMMGKSVSAVGDFGFTVRTGAGIIATAVIGSQQYNDGNWHYAVGRKVGTTVELYVDGSFKASGSHGSLGSTSGAAILEVAKQWIGKIDEVRISKVARSADYIATTHNNHNNPSTFYSVSAGQPVSPSFTYYRKITIDHNKAPGDLTDFPFLFNTINADLKTKANGGKVENTALGGASGSLTVPADLVFSPYPDGSDPYDFEVEKYDPATGELVAHVRIPSVSSSEDTVFYLVYGDSEVTTSQENVTGTWDANFKGVWHLAEASGTQHDSTSNNNDGTPTGTTQDDGKIGKARNFNGTANSYISIPSSPSFSFGTGGYTVEFWIKTAKATRWDPMNTYGSNGWWFYWAGLTNFTFQDCGGGTVTWVTPNLTDNVWRRVVAVRDGSTMTIFRDGAQVAQATGQAIGNISSTTQITIGKHYVDNNYFVNGLIDEVRISSVVRSANYIQATYNNQSSPGTFYTLGEAQLNWDDWAKHRQLTISAAADNGVSAGYTVRFNVTGDDAAAIYNACLASGDDFRIVYWDGSSWVELDRDLVMFSATEIEVWFKLQADIAGGVSDDNYYVYYDNPGAGAPPVDRSSVYFFFDGFEVDNWTDVGGQIGVDTQNDWLAFSSGRIPTKHYSYKALDHSGDWEMRFKLVITDADAKSLVEGLGFNSQAGTWNDAGSNGVEFECVRTDSDVELDFRVGLRINAAHTIALTVIPAVAGTWYVKLQQLGNTAWIYVYSDEAFSTLIGSNSLDITAGKNYSQNYLLVSNYTVSPTSAYIVGYYDDLLVRELVATEPTVEAVSEAAAQPYSFIM